MKRPNASKKCRRFRHMSNRVSKRSTIDLRSSPRRSVVIFEICLIRYGEGAESVGRNVEISTPVELHTLRLSTIHFAQSPAPVAQPSFAQVLDSVARTNATLASQVPRIECKSDSCPRTIAAGIAGTHSRMEDSHFATKCDCVCKFCHAVNSWRQGSGKPLGHQSAGHRLFHEGF
jgi:hypothetical protein